MRLILASASPRRADLLTQAGYDFEIRTADIDERIRAGEAADVYVRRLASEKSAAVSAAVTSDRDDNEAVLILGADTAVVVDGRILGKPVDRADAAGMLGRLSGRAHEVLTGVSLRRGLGETGAVERTTVWMTSLTPAEIDWYVLTGEGRDKAGAYAIQGLASRFIPRIDGSYSNVVGLPVATVHELVRRATDGLFPALHRAPGRAILDQSRSRKSL